MGGCSAVYCTNRQEQGFQLFRFPKDDKRRKLWMVKVRRDKWKPKEYSKLCHEHFEADQFVTDCTGKRRLAADAVPTIFKFPAHLMPKKKPGRASKAVEKRHPELAAKPTPSTLHPPVWVRHLCVDCGHGFTTQMSLVTHRKSHMAEPRHKCQFCDKTFTNMTEFLYHRRTHIDRTTVHDFMKRHTELAAKPPPSTLHPPVWVRPVPATVRMHSSGQAAHMHTLSEVGRHLCVDCGHGFTTEISLVTHRKSHMADPWHKCQFCDKTFTNMTEFLYHRRTHLDRPSTTVHVFMVPAPSKASPSTLDILQKARERREASHVHQEAGEASTLLPPLSCVEMGSMGEEDTAHSSQQPSDQSEEEERLEEKSSKDTATPTSAADRGPHKAEETSEMNEMNQPVEVEQSCKEPERMKIVNQVPAPSLYLDILQKARELREANLVHREGGEASTKVEVSSKPSPTRDVKLLMKGNGLCTPCTRKTEGSFPICKEKSSPDQKKRGHRLIQKKAEHPGGKPFSCTLCGSSFSHERSLKLRMMIHTGRRKAFSCTRCGGSFSHERSLKLHMTIHTREKTFSCKVCGKSFSQARTLKTHMRIHMGEKLCEVCGRTFSNIQNLKRHMVVHTGEKAFSCTVCGKSFSQAYYLRRHMMIHTGKKPIRCNLCDRSFSENGTLKSHIRVHTGVKPFSCTLCGQRFSQTWHLKSHMGFHTGEKPFNCTVCGKSFIRIDSLKRHMIVHKGEKPFRCAV